LSKWFQTRRYLWEFPIRSYVKLSSAVVAILVGGLKCRTQFWKGTTQRSFQQSLVEIGSVVSEENIFFKFHSPFFSIFSLPAILVESRDHRTQIWKGAMQRPFHQSLVAIGPVVSEEKIVMLISNRVLYVKLSSTVGAILVEGPNRRTQFWKRTIQWLFHQNLVLIEQMVYSLMLRVLAEKQHTSILYSVLWSDCGSNPHLLHSRWPR
jgi:hypothetical protein